MLNTKTNYTNFLLIHSNKFNLAMQAPEGIHRVCKQFPRLKLVTSEIDTALNKDLRVIPGMGEFGDRYFGTKSK